LKDSITDSKNKSDSAFKKMNLEETVNYLSHGCPTVKGFLRKVSDGSTLASALKDYKTKTGFISIGRRIAKKIESKKNCKNLVKNIIRGKINMDRFVLLNYHVGKYHKLYYTIELKKTQEVNTILKAIRRFRKNKEMLTNKIIN
jgi:hypothetical protein